MDPTNPLSDAKYQKLALEYSKLRASSQVLKKAVIEEQNKNAVLRETIRLKDVDLRRCEQEVDSLSFRNKQLEHRVGSLQGEIEQKQASGKQKKLYSLSSIKSLASNGSKAALDDNVVADEFQKKIIENAQLISVVADKNQELDMCQRRLRELEEEVNEKVFKQTLVEDQLRQELDQTTVKNTELEMKLLEAVAGRDDVSVTPSEGSSGGLGIMNPLDVASSATSIANNERLMLLETELNALRTKYALLASNAHPDTSTGDSADRPSIAERALADHFSKRMEDMFMEKSMAESKLVSYLAECDSLRNQLEITMNEVRDREQQLTVLRHEAKSVDDQLQTTRLNYEEQISVLTEQVLSLSDQLASKYA